jgi:hypothetical protein
MCLEMRTRSLIVMEVEDDHLVVGLAVSHVK